MSYTPPLKLQKTAFGELVTAEYTPVIQQSSQYGQLANVTSIELSGTTGAADSKFFAETTATNPSLAALLSNRALIYRPGQGGAARFTAAFDTPVVGNEQDAGLLGFNDTLTFGYKDLDYGIWYRRRGKQEVQTLTITAGAGGAETATVTIDGAAYSVSLSAGTVQLAAYEIMTSLNSQLALWDFDMRWDGVSATAEVIAIQNLVTSTVGAFAFSSATAAATWAQASAAVDWTIDFIKQADWNGDYDFTINPQNLTVYGVSFEYLGAGGIKFFIENPEISDFETVHTIAYSGTSTETSLLNPSFKIGIASENKTNSTAIRVESASYAGFIEGKRVFVNGSSGASQTSSIGTVLTNLVTIRNRNEFGLIRNLAEVIPVSASLQADATRPVEVRVIKNATPAAAGTGFEFDDYDNGNSSAQIATNAIAISNGETIAASGPGFLNLVDLAKVLVPGDTITIAAKLATGVGVEMTGSLNWVDQA